MSTRTSLVALGFVVVGLLAGAGCHTAAHASVEPDAWDAQLVVTLEAESETSGPFLSFNNPDASATSIYKATTDTNSGQSATIGALTGGQGQAWEFKGVVPETRYLNLSTPVFGTIYWTDSRAQATGSKAVASGVVRVDVFHGVQRIGGEVRAYNAAASANEPEPPWFRLPFSFWPETALLEGGQELRVRVTRVSGLADFFIGTGGKQSFVEFRTLATNPLAGTLYLENGRIVSSAGSDALSTPEFFERVEEFRARGGLENAPPGLVQLPPRPQDGSSVLAFGLFLLPGLALALPKRRSVLAATLLVGIAFAGCLGGDAAPAATGASADPDAPTPTVEASYEDAPHLTNGTGEVEGNVHDDIGLPVANAHIALLGTNHFSKTSKRGDFTFRNVTQGTYMLRVDAEKFQPLEQSVTVQAGQVARLNITIVPPGGARPGNDKAHLHDDWGGATESLFEDTTFSPRTVVGTTGATAGNTYVCDGMTDSAAGTHRRGCETPIPINPTNKHVLPGTTELEIRLNWNTGGNAPKQMGLRVMTPNSYAIDKIYVERPPNEPFRVTIYPNEADPGHQKFTNWEFFALMPTTDLYAPFGPPAYFGSEKVSIRIVLHKGVVPYEPSHRDFWGGASELPLWDKAAAKDYTCLGCDLPDVGYFVVPGKGFFVPPGTKEIKGKMTYTGYSGAPSAVEWNVWYKAANVPAAQAESHWKRAEFTRGSGAVEFTITPTAEEVDQFYQSASYWVFYPGDDNPDLRDKGLGLGESAHGLLGYGSSFTFSATVIRDPSYNPT